MTGFWGGWGRTDNGKCKCKGKCKGKGKGKGKCKCKCKCKGKGKGKGKAKAKANTKANTGVLRSAQNDKCEKEKSEPLGMTTQTAGASAGEGFGGADGYEGQRADNGE